MTLASSSAIAWFAHAVAHDEPSLLAETRPSPAYVQDMVKRIPDRAPLCSGQTALRKFRLRANDRSEGDPDR